MKYVSGYIFFELCLCMFQGSIILASEVSIKGTDVPINVTACFDDTIILKCDVGKKVAVYEVVKGYSSPPNRSCDHQPGDCIESFNMCPWCSCFWQKDTCLIRPFTNLMQLMTNCSKRPVMASYYMAVHFKCVNESRIAEMCHTNHLNNTIESTHAHIISPGYAGSFAQNNNKCHLTLLPIAQYQYTRFTLYSIEFHIQPLDPTLDECCEESVQYVKIRIFRVDESVETLYFCGQAQVNVSYVATRVDVTFKREAIGLPGFHIIYTAENATYIPESTTTSNITTKIPSSTTTLPTETTTPSNNLDTWAIILICGLVLVFIIGVTITTVILVIKLCRGPKSKDSSPNPSEVYLGHVLEQNSNVRCVDDYNHVVTTSDDNARGIHGIHA